MWPKLVALVFCFEFGACFDWCARNVISSKTSERIIPLNVCLDWRSAKFKGFGQVIFRQPNKGRPLRMCVLEVKLMGESLRCVIFWRVIRIESADGACRNLRVHESLATTAPLGGKHRESKVKWRTAVGKDLALCGSWNGSCTKQGRCVRRPLSRGFLVETCSTRCINSRWSVLSSALRGPISSIRRCASLCKCASALQIWSVHSNVHRRNWQSFAYEGNEIRNGIRDATTAAAMKRLSMEWVLLRLSLPVMDWKYACHTKIGIFMNRCCASCWCWCV